jgi:hypothetical protein
MENGKWKMENEIMENEELSNYQLHYTRQEKENPARFTHRV